MSCAPLTMQPAPVPKAKPLHVHKPLVLKPSVEATYLFERLINEGSTACVYEARSRYTEQAVAVKEVRRTSATTAVVLNERDMLTGLDHPNIARLLDFDETSTSYFIVQELCKHGDLFDVIAGNKEKVTEAKAIHWIRGALQGLVYLHERGIVHRDVKMENVALAADGSVKLIDFGYASAWDYVSKYTPGTEEYIAPELFTRQPDSACDLRKADVWAAGVLLFTLLTAAMDRCVFPWTRADDKSESFKAYRSTGEVPRRPWATFSNTARFLLLNMLKVDPRERCTAAEALAFVNDHWPVAVRSKPSFLRMSSSISTASTDSGFDSDDSFSRISSDRTTTADILRHARLPSISTPVKVAAAMAPLLPATGGQYDLELLSFGIALPPTPEHSAPMSSKKRKTSDSDAKQPSQKRGTKRQRRQPAQQAS